ncbi:TPA: PapB/FocB family fimbrial expression transcriptional regulator, partial [Escherichia coli]
SVSRGIRAGGNQGVSVGIYHSRVAGIYDTPGSMSDAHFEILAALSPVNSKKVILALRDYFVLGLTRREACENHDVAQGYFSVSLRKLLETNRLVAELAELLSVPSECRPYW